MDQGIKRLIQSHPADVLALALPGAEVVGPLSIDVAAEPQLVLDTLLRIRYGGEECAVDVEAEAQPRGDIGRRLYDYVARARIVTGLSVVSVVFWLNAGGPPPPSPYEERVGDLVLGTWRFFGVAVYSLPAATLIGRGLVGLLPLVPFTREGGDPATVERAAAAIKERAPAGEVEELAFLLALFASRTIGAGRALEIIRRLLVSIEILETSPLYQRLVREATDKGLSQGIEQGLHDAALVALRGRLGDVSPELAQALAGASREAILDLLAHIASDSPEQIRARLGL